MNKSECSKISKMSLVTYAKVFGFGQEERVLLCLGCLASTEGSSSGFLTGSRLGFGRLVIETKSAMQ